MTNTFWFNNPYILFDNKYIFNVWPTKNMNFEEKLNSLNKLIILLSIIGFLLFQNIHYLLIGIITLIIIYIIYSLKNETFIKNIFENKEGFKNQILINNDKIYNKNEMTTNPITLESILKSNFYPTNKLNPMGNVLLTEIMDSPNRKAAAPSFNPDVYEDIMRSSKKTVQHLNPGIKDTNKQLFGDLAQNFELDWSMRNFYSMPNTRITNDQGAFAKYLYGNMPSCRDGDGFACVQDNLRYLLI